MKYSWSIILMKTGSNSNKKQQKEYYRIKDWKYYIVVRIEIVQMSRLKY